ncbi:dynein axonemal heavy chain 3 [Ischnura elegans]|uniref:dynein axonemal heavy chain 3 n=1 Tax=Ischnura elegans TaxID=197161 RepID=UPI001ED8B521|nr:dynein axonemal heavy chain 3 [Ischnura elegans]
MENNGSCQTIRGAKRKFSCREYNKTGIRKVPFLPIADDKPLSPHLQSLLEKDVYPPLLEEKSWTKAVPYNESFLHYSPSELIGSNYTPNSRNMRIRRLPSFRPKKVSRSLIPSKKSKPRRDFIPVDELVIGHHDCPNSERQTSRAIKKTPLRHITKSKTMNELELLRSRKYSHLQARLPVHPDDQLDEMRNFIEIDQSKYVREEDLARIEHYIHNEIGKHMIENYPIYFLENAKRKLKPKYFTNKRLEPVFEELKREIIENYYLGVRKTIVDYIMLDERERIRLDIQTFPIAYSTMTIRAPIPWHQQIINSRQFVSHNVYIGDASMLALRRLWEESFRDRLIIPVKRLDEVNPLPLDLQLIENQVKLLCAEARSFLLNEWLPQCADIFARMKECWIHLVPRKKSDSLVLIEKYFNSGASLMSIQLRSLVVKSLYHLLEMMKTFQEGNNYSGEYQDYMYLNAPMIKVYVLPVLGTSELKFSPDLAEIRAFVLNCFESIISVNTHVPRVEQYLFPEFKGADLFLSHVSLEEVEVVSIIQSALEIFDLNLPGPKNYLKTYEKYLHILNGDAEKSRKEFMSKDPFPLLKDFSGRIIMYEELKNEILFLRKEAYLNFIGIDATAINDTLWNIVDTLRTKTVDYHVLNNRTHNRGICNEFDIMADRASEMPDNTQELVELTNYLTDSREVTMFNLREKIRTAAENVLFLMTHAILPGEDVQLNSRVFLWPKDMESVFELSETRLSHRRDLAEKNLREKTMEFEERLLLHQKDLEAVRRKDPPILTMEEMKENADCVEALSNTLKDDKAEADAINEEEQLLEWQASPFSTLQKMMALIDPVEKLWTTVLKFHQDYDVWYYGPFLKLDAQKIEEDVDAIWKTLYKLTKIFHDLPGSKRVAEMVKAKVEKFKLLLPVLHTICNKGMKERHWQQISEIVGVQIVPTEESTLAEMIEYGVPKHITELQDIGTKATKEYGLEQSLEKMKSEWKDVRFECIPYRETGVSILSALDDIQMMLDDHILKAQTMRGSPYVKAFEAEMQQWEDKLISMQDILDAWMKCQVTWLYLEPIFTSEDIKEQMPDESSHFMEVDRVWRRIMNHTVKNPLVLIATDYPNMLKSLQESNQLLEDIQKGLNSYLEQKRLFFARFFFLSNDELLEILSETKDPTRVQPHLRKCFEGISRLKFTEEEEIVAMISAENELVPLSGSIVPANAKGMVEKWLIKVEDLMLKTVRDICMDASGAYFDTPRRKWVLEWPGQVVLCGSIVHWTAEVSQAIEKDLLSDYLQKSNEQIEEIVELVRGNLTPGGRVTLCALIVMDVHARDVVKKLVELNINNVSDFSWISQLRYYLRDESVIVCMITTDVEYGFEYLGNTPRLVITPLTDRCYRTLMGALKLNLGGAPEGPAGTGKTETSKDLAKAVAKQCVVFNCSEGLDYKAMGKFFKGLAQTGAWACFDEFNRIELEVLSVVAQQIYTIQTSISQKLEYIQFEGTTLKLNPTCTIFITMNPGYAGRQELPDNLKVLFRTVAMMVPDYAMIGEISLYSMGFVDARSLADKIVATYRLCSEQLSSQHHYDYGMRAVKTVLTAAGNLKLKYQDVEESKLVLRAIVDVNLPKFLAQDVPLFEGIISDLFPGIELPKPDRGELMDALEVRLKDKNLQCTPWYIEKIIQLYEMILVRHGLMIVGEALGGKTCAYQTLAEALGDLKNSKTAIMREQQVQFKIINPKSITLGQLYGCFDEVSHEWSDGVLATTFREFTYATAPDRKWIMFDGPVDAVWIESMNTVLDDNKKLCLMSGEIIQMSNTMNLIFETGDLEQASPATVSRCGMIYMEPGELGWQSLCKSFLFWLSSRLLSDQLELIEDMINWLVPAILDCIFHRCQRFIVSSELHLFMCFTKLCKIMLEGEQQVSTVWLQNVFIFCLVWGYGASLNGDSRKIFDEDFRAVLNGDNESYPRPNSFKLSRAQLFPVRGTVFDFIYDKRNNGSWIVWLEINEKSNSQWPQNAKVSDLIVPTSETAYQSFFIQKFLSCKVPFLMVGPTGTGKSAITINYLMNLPTDKFLPNVVNFSARTSAGQTQDIIMSKLDRRRKGVFGPPLGKKYVLFVDDLSMPQKETYGAQPPIELLRQWIDHGYWYDKKDTTKMELIDILFVSAMLPPGGGRNDVTSRFIRHMNIISMDSFEDKTLMKIFCAIVDWQFGKGYDSNIARMSKLVVEGTMNVYKSAIVEFLPIPAKSHYIFNLRDFSRVIRGILLVPASHLVEPEKLVRLWIHEIYRVFYDRLIDVSDRQNFFEIVKKYCYDSLRQRMEKILSDLIPPDEPSLKDDHIRSLLFGNYMEPDADPKIYDEIPDLEVLMQKMDYYLDEYNMMSKRPMYLVMFKFAIEHVSRISRILAQDNGHALLVGIGGSGRKSDTQLATHIAGYQLFQVEITKTYGRYDWMEDLKVLLKKAGLGGKPVVFLFADSQIKDESFIEDINMILNTGDVPNLFPADEKADILEGIQDVARVMGKKIEATPLALYNFFIERVRANLHVVLAFSPIGNAFRNRLRMFPSLINCCTIDWFTAWPLDALERVAYFFLKDLEIADEMRSSCVEMCKHFHSSVLELSEKFYHALRRHNYVTPTSYIELILTFLDLYKSKTLEINKLISRYSVGLEKLDFASSQVSVMQDELTALHPQLVDTSEQTEKLMIKIEQDTVVVEAKKEIVGADEALANEAAAAAQAIKDDCESDLAEAIPALDAALVALNTLKPADITVVKSMKNPPTGVKLVMEAICVMKGIKPERKPDPQGSGKMVEDFWGPSLKLLGDLKFLDSLKTYNKDNIPPGIMKRIRERFIPDRDFRPEKIKTISNACEGLCKWVLAMEVYDRVIKIVAPKQAKFKEAEAELAAQMATLDEKRAQLQKVTDKLQALNDEFAAMTKKKKDLEENIEICSQKLHRAEKLIGGLGGEKARWSELAEMLEGKLKGIIGDVLLSAGVVAYLGAFTVDFRQGAAEEWKKYCMSLHIPCSETFSLVAILGEPVEIRAWNIHGLPVDAFSVENGIIVSRARRWPLMIDPQNQANKWVKNMEKENNLSVIKLSNPTYMRTLETCITVGLPALLENVGEEIDANLEPILLQQTYKEANIEYLKVGENALVYSHDFRFYITTRLRNPHYLPEVAVKVTLLNFMITQLGLQDQLLGILVAKERPDLEEKKNELIIESATNKKMLKEIEDKILEVLSTSEGNILEDETALQILSSSKVLSEDIQAKQEVAAKTEVEIDHARDEYKPVSHHSSVLFFCISELANIDPMYQYSLVWFIHLYVQSIINSEPSEKLNIRLDNLNTYFTKSIYENVCRSLFEKHKLIFSFVLCAGIMDSKGLLPEEAWAFFLTGGVALENPYPNPDHSWLTDKSWTEVVKASSVKGLEEFRLSLSKHTAEWKEFYSSPSPQTATFPEPYKGISGLMKLVILKSLRPDKIVPAVQDFISLNMSKSFIEPPPFDLEGAYSDSNCCTPLIFILSPGADPMASLMKFAASKGISSEMIQTISLGQGQGPIAEDMIYKAVALGHWVVLQNCHLAESWMGSLEKVCEDAIVPETTHERFRIWLTSYPSGAFPVSILQNGVKMTNEPPKGMKSNLMRSYMNDPISDEKFFNACGKVKEWQYLLFGLCFFHALVQERRNFGPLGWNIPYEFNESDLRISVMQLQMFLNDYDEIPFEALAYLTGECNYGGRVTDDKDRRLLLSLLSIVYTPELIENPNYSFSEIEIYHLPPDTTVDGCIEFIKTLPLITPPEVYGLHENADISKDINETRELLHGVLLTQTQISSGVAGVDSGKLVIEIAVDILEKLPALFDLEAVAEKYPVLYSNSMNTVLRQELVRFNKLTKEIEISLIYVQRAVKGSVVMSPELEDVHNSLLVGRIPATWASKSYPSLKPLGGYIADLLARLKFFEKWINDGAPVVFWISGFYFTQSFLTGVAQNYARKFKIPIDHLSFDFEITSIESDAENTPDDGEYCKLRPSIYDAYIEGLFLEGARWDRDTMALGESFPKVLYDTVPVIWLKPELKINIHNEGCYECPVYKTSARRGTLSTTGHSTNFVLYITFPTLRNPDHWINRGVACLCQLDN